MKVSFESHNFELTNELEKYTHNKLAPVIRRIPRAVRQSASFHVSFTQKRSKGAKYNTCHLTLSVPNMELQAEETTLHMYAALDVTVVHIDQYLKDFVAAQRRTNVRATLRRQLRADWQPPHA